ncbi:hypothetical protein SFRURICE_017803 [Spodoptera frugiperda]|nr:hypothetical protein SFRURICE_017803 [Spodoptera frugiperda]
MRAYSNEPAPHSAAKAANKLLRARGAESRRVPSKSPFPPYVPRAALTIPHVFLHLAPSIIPGAGLGVFSTLTLPRGVRFGPYCGVRTQVVDSMYCWQIYDRDHKRSHVVDAADANRSNWMRYVNCARNWKEQNLLAYQYQGQLYYRTIKIIPRFTELMVFYGSEFANTLHINLRNYNSPPGYAQKFGAPAAKKPKLDIQKEKIQEVTPDKSKLNLQTKDEEKVISKKSINKNKKALRTKLNSVQKDLIIENNNIKNKDLHNENSSKLLQCTINMNNDNFMCKHCNFKGINSHDIERHSLKHNNIKDRPYKCDICETSFSEKCNLNNHIRTHTGEKPYKCDICKRSYSVKCNLDRHIRIHTGEKPHKCDICESRFIQKGNLDNHIRTHTGEKPYKCDICESSFSVKCTLDKHIRTHTGEKPYKCDICKRSYSVKCNLDRHIRTHTGEKPYKCDICESRFSQKGHLDIHIVHTLRSYSVKCNLDRHIRIHTGEKPHKCDICESRFIQKGNLDNHIRTHTGEKPYKCDICESSFSSSFSLKCNLDRHIRIHTGEKPHKCDICESRFIQKGNLDKHIRTHTGEKPYKCDICESRFRQSNTLKVHVMRIHAVSKKKRI